MYDVARCLAAMITHYGALKSAYNLMDPYELVSHCVTLRILEMVSIKDQQEAIEKFLRLVFKESN